MFFVGFGGMRLRLGSLGLGGRRRFLGEGRRGLGVRKLRRTGARLRLGFGDDAVDEGIHARRLLLQAGEPGGLAARAAHGPPGGAERSRVDHVGRGTVRTDDQHDFVRFSGPANVAAVR